MRLSDITNRAQKGCYKAGAKAFREGKPRQPPYSGTYFSRIYFDRAWLGGYDAEARKGLKLILEVER